MLRLKGFTRHLKKFLLRILRPAPDKMPELISAHLLCGVDGPHEVVEQDGHSHLAQWGKRQQICSLLLGAGGCRST